MPLSRRLLIGSAIAGVVPGRLGAQTAPSLKIGVLGDQSGPYRDFSGPVSIACARQAIADFGGQNATVEIKVLGRAHPVPWHNGFLVVSG